MEATLQRPRKCRGKPHKVGGFGWHFFFFLPFCVFPFQLLLLLLFLFVARTSTHEQMSCGNKVKNETCGKFEKKGNTHPCEHKQKKTRGGFKNLLQGNAFEWTQRNSAGSSWEKWLSRGFPEGPRKIRSRQVKNRCTAKRYKLCVSGLLCPNKNITAGEIPC